MNSRWNNKSQFNASNEAAVEVDSIDRSFAGEHIEKILKIRTTEKFAVITLKFEQPGFTIQ